jgi:hypothetical protein
MQQYFDRSFIQAFLNFDFCLKIFFVNQVGDYILIYVALNDTFFIFNEIDRATVMIVALSQPKIKDASSLPSTNLSASSKIYPLIVD